MDTNSRKDLHAHPSFDRNRTRYACGCVRGPQRRHAMKNWHWYDPPVLFPIGLLMLIACYAALRTLT